MWSCTPVPVQRGFWIFLQAGEVGACMVPVLQEQVLRGEKRVLFLSQGPASLPTDPHGASPAHEHLTGLNI